MFRRKLCALIIGSVLGAGLVGVPAAADPHDNKTRQSGVETPTGPQGTPIASVTVKADSIKGNKRAEDLTCLAYWSPSPQYSASNNTIHYGIWISCNYVAAVSLKVQIFVKEAAGGYMAADSPITSNQVSQFPSVGGHTACFPGSSGQWMAKFWGTAAVSGNFLPYPSLSPAPTFPCT
ncbi:hypothetical protein ACQP2P_16235 [Dactylosporangium sp. CA-139114]|uniref:hypothetical protein n=1 Tax=Dactylosporangium sp. CA-139114 TaxID=3239931 RepID=UPI003D95A5EF